MVELHDLLLLSHRGELSPADAERLEKALTVSTELRISQLMCEGFEREASAKPGDEQLFRQLLQNVGSPAMPSRSPRLSRMWLNVGAPLLVASAAAAAALGYQWGKTPTKPKSGPAELSGHSVPAQKLLPVAPELEVLTVPPLVETKNSQRRPYKFELSKKSVNDQVALPEEQKTVAKTSQKGRQRRAPRTRRGGTVPTETALARKAPGKAKSFSARTKFPTVKLPPRSTEKASIPAELLLQARRLRRTSWDGADEIYQKLVADYPSSTESGLAEMALAKRAQEHRHFVRALHWYQLHQKRRDSPLRIEALWEEAMVQRSLGRSQLARRAFEKLAHEYPSTPFGEAALRLLSSSKATRSAMP